VTPIVDSAENPAVGDFTAYWPRSFDFSPMPLNAMNYGVQGEFFMTELPEIFLPNFGGGPQYDFFQGSLGGSPGAPPFALQQPIGTAPPVPFNQGLLPMGVSHTNLTHVNHNTDLGLYRPSNHPARLMSFAHPGQMILAQAPK